MVSDDNLNSQEAGGLFPRLQERFGLRADPLAMENPFFAGAQRQYALESLRQMSGFGDMAVLLCAPSGLGKTRLLAELVRSESSRLEFHRLGSAALGSPQALVRDLSIVARGLDLEAGPKAALSQFFHWSEKRASKGQRMVLLIDNAEQAPADVLHLVLNGFLGANRSLAALPVFAGTDVLSDTMDLAQQAPGAVHKIVLAPLNRDELTGYLRPRVKLAGGNAEELLSAARVKRVHARSLGNFYAIQRVTPAVWLDMAGRVAPARRRVKIPWRSLAWPLLALILLAASWLFVARQYDTAVGEEDAKAQAQIPERVRKSLTVGPEAVPGQGPIVQSTPSAGPAEPEPVVVGSDSATEAEPESKPAPASEPQPVPSPQTAAEIQPDQITFVPARPDRFVPLQQLRNSGGWTLQLVAGNQEQTALTVFRRYPQVDAMVYTRGERHSGPWFMVFQGNYPSRTAAQQASQTLPAGLVSAVPWVRENRNL